MSSPTHTAPSNRPAFEAHKAFGFEWNPRFFIVLMLLVVGINAGLALMLGKVDRATTGALPDVTGNTHAQDLSHIAPSASAVTTRTYLSPEEKRLLLQHLQTPPAIRPQEQQH